MWTNSAANTACSKPARRARRFLNVSPAAGPRPHIFVFLCWLALPHAPATAAGPAADPACTVDDAEPVTVVHVIDGDTVVLADRERVRLIGIDAPELARDDRPAEYGAEVARTALETLLRQAETVTARTGHETRDRYGRLLAHLYADGRNVQAILLEDGLAVPLIIPPNIHHIDCYEQATASARAAQRGLWAHPDYRVHRVDELNRDARGYHVVTGRVQRIGRSRSAIWVNLADDFALRITRDDLEHFDGIDFEELVGRELEARGFIYERNEQLRMRIRHPADMQEKGSE